MLVKSITYLGRAFQSLIEEGKKEYRLESILVTGWINLIWWPLVYCIVAAGMR